MTVDMLMQGETALRELVICRGVCARARARARVCVCREG